MSVLADSNHGRSEDSNQGRSTIDMALIPSLIYPTSLLLYLAMATEALAASYETQQQREDQFMPSMRDVDSALYTEAVPSHDFTLSNVSSTIEEILVEVGILQDTDTR